ncbi:DUF4190 domain-containing protein [Streptomyces sp. MNU76]|uniref:DUF4190 domain-containing protein n=1 Tax=Streptomyces sp. MNU76 TaxID=2560026 RepID=UPI001E4C7748|nr:DUF4190 domain-containing protein [Streptomyces sp. MNU76]MCC9709812.1 DUF4190 domain-containing protein [Streptomyces sp. MNU76]
MTTVLSGKREGGTHQTPASQPDTPQLSSDALLGLLGLLVLNLFLGPIAIVLAAVALKRGTTRRGRAFLGLGLGVADLIVLATLMQTTNTVSWSI